MDLSLPPRSKSNLTTKDSTFTQLTILYCFIYIGGNFLDTFSIISNIFMFDIYVRHDFVSVTGNVLLFLSHGVRLFVNYRFNSIFRIRFREIFNLKTALKWIKSCSFKKTNNGSKVEIWISFIFFDHIIPFLFLLSSE